MKETEKRSKGHEKRPLGFRSSEQAQEKLAYIRVILQIKNIQKFYNKNLK